MASMSPVTRRSISLPEDIDSAVEAAAVAAGLSVSAWLADLIERHFRIEWGLAGVAEWEAEHGAITDEEMAEERARVERLWRDQGPGPIRSRSA